MGAISNKLEVNGMRLIHFLLFLVFKKAQPGNSVTAIDHAAAVGLFTLRLFRSQIGRITLGGLKPGAWRDVSPAEVERLKKNPD